MIKKDYVVLDQQIAGIMMCLKHRVKRVRPDNECITKNVYIFENTLQFEKDFNFIRKNKNELYNLLTEFINK